MISICILGSTGSIGKSVFKIIDHEKKNIKIRLLSANKNFKLICYQIKKYKPNYFIVNNHRIYLKVKNKFKKNKTKILNNFDNIKFRNRINISISAIPGIAGLSPTKKMVKFVNKLLIANKESIICGWEILKKDAKKYKTKIIPVDSEHYSIMKLLENHNNNEIKKIYLTASGGPFLKFKPNKLKYIKPKDAMKHPKWKMGKKISIDSSTLMNKILELIEAQKLFNIPNDKIDILIHPNSLVHAIIELKNGLKKFIYHETSMIIPLANAMFDGKLNIDNYFNNNLNKNKKIIENLIFEKVDKKIFPIIKLKNIANKYPSSAIIINASNEILVDHFLRKKIPFLSISKIIMGILRDRNYKKYAIRRPKNIKQINKIDNWARQITIKKIK